MSKPYHIPSIANYYKGYLPAYAPHDWERTPGTEWGVCEEKHAVTGEVRHRGMPKHMCTPSDANWQSVRFHPQ